MKENQHLFDKKAIEYDQWFDKHQNVFYSELLAIKRFVPAGQDGVGIGVGTGRFASHLGIQKGIEPALGMAKIARERGVDVIEGVAESLPYADNQFDFVLMVTVDCFVDNIEKAYNEAYRVLKTEGIIIIGLLDKNGVIAKKYQAKKAVDSVYRLANFHSTEETVRMLKKPGFGNFEFCQTLTVADPPKIEPAVNGYDKGGFVVIKAVK